MLQLTDSALCSFRQTEPLRVAGRKTFRRMLHESAVIAKWGWKALFPTTVVEEVPPRRLQHHRE